MNQGDYVLATKYRDGDPGDQFCVGFFAGTFFERFLVVDEKGASYRAGGFRRCEPISREFGAYIVENIKQIEAGDVSLWDIKAKFSREERS